MPISRHFMPHSRGRLTGAARCYADARARRKKRYFRRTLSRSIQRAGQPAPYARRHDESASRARRRRRDTRLTTAPRRPCPHAAACRTRGAFRRMAAFDASARAGGEASITPARRMPLRAKGRRSSLIAFRYQHEGRPMIYRHFAMTTGRSYRHEKDASATIAAAMRRCAAFSHFPR